MTILLLFSQAILLQAESNNIDIQIDKIKNAPEEQRYMLVNELKKQIAKMNALQQARAVSRYQEESLRAQQNANMANELQTINQINQEQERQLIVPTIDEPIVKHVPVNPEENFKLYDESSFNPVPEYDSSKESVPVEPLYHDNADKASENIPNGENFDKYVPVKPSYEKPNKYVPEKPSYEKPSKYVPSKPSEYTPKQQEYNEPEKPTSSQTSSDMSSKSDLQEPSKQIPSKSFPSKGRF